MIQYSIWRRFNMNANQANEKGLLSALSRLACKIINLCNRVDAIPGKRPEVLAFIIYAVAHLIMAIFHEPWYDEAVAWQIARCASVRDILFELPHYEGHPPLWHLILLPFAKLGAPYELSLTLVSLIFAGAAVGLIIWKSPFPRIIRLLLPFTYFFFYQYGVISRPYCVMMLAFMLLAMTYHGRNEKPGRYTLCLALLCLTSAYGIVIAGGLAIVWIWEIWNLQNLGKFFRTFSRDKRISWLAGLLVLALLLIVEIMPRGDTYATSSITSNEDSKQYFSSIMYTLLALPADVCLTSLYSYTLLQETRFPIAALISTCILGSMLWGIAIIWGKEKKILSTLVVPYILYAVFAAMMYMYHHHMGVGLLIALFWIWVSLNNDSTVDSSAFRKKDIVDTLTVIAAIVMATSLWWSISSCFCDLLQTYAPGRNEAVFIEENGLDDYRIMVGWDVIYDKNENVLGMDINHCHCADNIAPYFEHNLFMNFNYGRDDVNYSTHKRSTEEETQLYFAEWSESPPDVLFNNPELSLIYNEDDLNMDNYTLVYSELNNFTWKGYMNYGRTNIHVRNDLATELGLEEVELALPFYYHFIDWLINQKGL